MFFSTHPLRSLSTKNAKTCLRRMGLPEKYVPLQRNNQTLMSLAGIGRWCRRPMCMGRLLAIDYGKRRTGVAVSDPLQLIANGLETIPTTELLDFLHNYMEREPVDCVVVGYPRQTNGEESENMKRIIPFVNRLRKLYPRLRVELYDERYTTILAQRALLEGGKSRRSLRENKGLIDKVSATIILEDYMRATK